MPPPSPKPLVSIVILTWNSGVFIDRCLEGLSRQSLQNLEIMIVDNASTDDTLERVGQSPHGSIVTKVVANPENLGCAGGNNVGWRASRGEVVVFLNPDVYVTKQWLEELAGALLKDPRAVIAGCKIYYPNTHILQHAGGILYPNAMADHRGKGEEDRGQFDDPCEVDYVTGAAIAVKRDFLERVGGLDEDYNPAYYEETDLCFRARSMGYRVLYVPGSVLYHYESPGLTRFSPAFYDLFYKMRIRFVLKNYSLWEILTRFWPFEIRWMLFEPKARGFRLAQFKAWLQGIRFLIQKGKRRKGP